VTRYVEAFSWTGSTELWLETYVRERPVLHVCSGKSKWGDVTADLYEPADVKADWTSLPFESDSFASVFADPPWNSGYKADSALFVKEALRVAPVAYLMSPWVYGGAAARLTRVWVRQFPGVHAPILIVRYERPAVQIEAFEALRGGDAT
jgi:hypothetical protein